MGPLLASASQFPTVPATCWGQGPVRTAAHPRKWDMARKRAAPLLSHNAHLWEPGDKPFIDDLLLGRESRILTVIY